MKNEIFSDWSVAKSKLCMLTMQSILNTVIVVLPSILGLRAKFGSYRTVHVSHRHLLCDVQRVSANCLKHRRSCDLPQTISDDSCWYQVQKMQNRHVLKN